VSERVILWICLLSWAFVVGYSHFTFYRVFVIVSSLKSAAEERDTIAGIAKYDAWQLHANAVPTRCKSRGNTLMRCNSYSRIATTTTMSTTHRNHRCQRLNMISRTPARCACWNHVRHGAGPLQTLALLFALCRRHYRHKKRLSYLPFSYNHGIASFN